MRGALTKTVGESARLGVAGALERLREARLIEAEALGELIAVLASTPVELDKHGALTNNRSKDSGSPASPDRGACYLSVKQLAARMPYAEKTIRNLMHGGELLEGLHFFKCRGRVMFSWPAMRDWVEKRGATEIEMFPLVRNRRNGGSR